MDVRRRIIASVFERSDGSGLTDETYVSHLRIWEDAGPEGGESKSRYILLSRTNNGNGYIHKSKANSNGSFSVGKTWRLADLRAIQVINPFVFNITLARSYRWQTENANDQANFLNELVKLYRALINNNANLRLDGMSEPDGGPTGYAQNSPQPNPPYNPSGSASPASPSRRPGSATRTAGFDSPGRGKPGYDTSGRSQVPDYESSGRALAQGYESPRRGPSPQPVSQIRAETPPRMPSPSKLKPPSASPAQSRLSPASRQQTPQQVQPESSSSTIRPRPGRPSSNETSTSSQIPSINLSLYPSNGRANNTPSNTLYANGTLSTRAGTEHPLTPVSAYPPSPAYSRTPSPAPAEPPSRSERKDSRSTVVAEPQPVRQINPRVSFFDPANQATLDRLVTGDASEQAELEGEEESVQATLSNIEEMLEGYEWASDDVIGRKTARGTADLIEARLLDELMALEKANIHSFLESDDRISLVLKYMDTALAELDNMDSLISSYKIHLNAVSDDISYIQSQGRGLQVQTQNQRALLGELENLLQTVHVDRSALVALAQESLEKPSSIQRLEEAAAELYKALVAGRDRDMAATVERLGDYTTHNSQFCKRLFDFMSVMFVAQSKLVLGDTNGITRSEKRGRSSLSNHKSMEDYLGRYSGLMLYLKEMNEVTYGKLCAAYFSAASGLHSAQMKALLSAYLSKVKKASEEDLDIYLGSQLNAPGAKGTTGMRRAGTLMRSPIDGRNKDRDKALDGDLRAADALGFALEQITMQIYREDEFITDFLQINDAQLTFADYMSLDNYFRRQAGRSAGLSSATSKLIRNAMDLIFGFLPLELKTWTDQALAKDGMEVVGLLACIERARVDANERSHAFLLSVLEKQHMRLKGQFDRHINDQVKAIEQTKLTSKKRQGVAPFVKQFPLYMRRVEQQLVGAGDLEIRTSVDEAYERIVQTMFESLKHMAKMDGEGEDKGQLNYHVIMIENMQHFVAEMSQLGIGSVASFSRKAEGIYNENVGAYVKIVLRRPFAKIIDYFEGIEQQLKSVAQTELAKTSTYSRSALKKVVKEFNAKDVRKNIDVLFKRVEKHFMEVSEKATTEESGGIAQGTVMVGVWKACEEELLRLTEHFSKRIGQCYSDSGVSLEYTSGDVEAAFRRHRGD